MSSPDIITELYAYITTEPDGREGVPGVNVMVDGREMFVPLVGADRQRIDSHRSDAERIKRNELKRGRDVRIRLVRFVLVEELGDVG